MAVVDSRRIGAVLLLSIVMPHRLVRAADAHPVGDTASALPGIVRVGVPAAASPRLSVAGTAGYGFTEAQGSGDGAHHRAFGTAAIGLTPLPKLDLALRLDGRYDRHPDDGKGADSGFVGDPRVIARYGDWLSPSFALGVQAGAWFPGRDAPSFPVKATTVDANVLAAWQSAAGALVGASLGYRLDNSKESAPEPARLRLGDRIALGVSDFDAVLAAIGTSIPLGERSAVLGELSWDVLVGSGAPSALESPLRADIGFRHSLQKRLSLEVLAESDVGSRPATGPSAPRVPIEPRFTLSFGLRYQLPFGEAPAEAPAREEAPAPEPAKPTAAAAPTTAPVTIVLRDDKGAPISGAKVEATIGERTIALSDQGEGKYSAPEIPAGEGKLHATADGYEPMEQPLSVGAGREIRLDAKLVEVPPAGQLRGLIRSFSGKPLRATIGVDSLGKEVKTDEHGFFTLDVPPGEYEVRVVAPRYKTQKRKIRVAENGVTVLNAELVEGK